MVLVSYRTIGHGCMLIGHTSAISKGDVSIAYKPEQVLSLTIGHIGRLV